MTDERRFSELLTEFERVGVDLNSFPAGITVKREDAIRILRSLPDGAGPAAFLSRVRLDTPTREILRERRDDEERRAFGG